jgi:DNA processing protein
VTEAQYWLGFSLVTQMGPKRIRLLSEHFSSLAEAWSAPESLLRAAGLTGQSLSYLLAERNRIDLNAELARVRRVGAYLITQADVAYPQLLRAIPDAPPVLYVRGTLVDADETALAIVGTRSATQYGRDAAYRLARALAEQGVTIVSGLAQGVDAAAHQGALDGGGRTIAVLGSGIDRVYPTAHVDLALRIAESGAVVSEFALGSAPEARHFPRRNRIISGLSLGVLIAEAPEQSGALITAISAAEQGRDVFAVPGNIFNASHTGANRLIQDGAKLVTCADDVLSELRLARTETQTRRATQRIVPEDETEQQVLTNLNAEPLHIDDLARLTGLSIAQLSSTLTILELKGLARNVGHMQYCRSD